MSEEISCPLCSITGPSKWFAFQGKEVICCAICQRDTVEEALHKVEDLAMAERESRKQAEAALREARGSGFDGTMVMKRINAALAIPQEPAEPERGK